MARQIAFAEITAADLELYSILCNKDEQALNHLQEAYGSILYRHIFGIVHEEIRASVVLCETFKKIWLSLSLYEPGSPGLQSWMLRIAESCALSCTQEALQYERIQMLAPTGS